MSGTVKPYSYEYWFEKGETDRRSEWEPLYPKVKPYMDGWHSVEDTDQDGWGNVDFVTQ